MQSNCSTERFGQLGASLDQWGACEAWTQNWVQGMPIPGSVFGKIWVLRNTQNCLGNEHSRIGARGLGLQKEFSYLSWGDRKRPWGALSDRPRPGSAADRQPDQLNNCDGKRREATPFRQTPISDRRLHAAVATAVATTGQGSLPLPPTSWELMLKLAPWKHPDLQAVPSLPAPATPLGLLFKLEVLFQVNKKNK